MRVTAETKNATRERILGVAKRLFAEQGFDAATTRDIAREAQVATGTLFNYFPTKEAIALCLIGEVWQDSLESFAPRPNGRNEAEAGGSDDSDLPTTMEEDLFALAAAVLRKLKPFRKYLPGVLRTTLSPLASEDADKASLRTLHTEAIGQIVARHGFDEALTSMALHLYWTLFTGVLEFWANDRSPRQEDTLALLDESLAMFVHSLSRPRDEPALKLSQSQSQKKRG